MTATERLRALLDERGVRWWEGWYKDLTLFDGQNGIRWVADHTLGEWFVRSVLPITPEQAVDATLGPAYEPPIAAHWDGDVLVLTTPRDPSSVHVQRAEGQPRKVYPSEATLVAVTCKPVISDNLAASEGTGDAWADCSECGHLLYVLTDPGSEPPNYCPNCGRKVVE